MNDKKTVYKFLKENGKGKITYFKLTGEKRVMKCTLDLDGIKEAIKITDPNYKKANMNWTDPSLIVWDLEKNGFRKINTETVIDIEEIL